MTQLINPDAPIPKYQQLVNGIIEELRKGTWKLNDKLPSVNQLCQQNQVSRDTVLLAYNELKHKGYIEGRSGKGYYVVSTQVEASIRRIFLLFDELNSFKEQLHQSFMAQIPAEVKVDVYFHYFNEELFCRFIEENRHRYDAFVIMPVWFGRMEQYVKMLAPAHVVMLDQWPQNMPPICSGIYQDFYSDMQAGLREALPYLQKYRDIWLVHPGGKEPQAMKEGAEDFASRQGLPLKHAQTIKDLPLEKYQLYLVVNDGQLLEFCARCKQEGLKPGKELGLISYNDSPFKPFVFEGIATISTDFARMGQRLAELVFASEHIREKNPARFIFRKSL